MSRFKTNEKVYIKATGALGIIKGREVTKIDDKRIKVEYIVKTGDGFDNWKPYLKKELVKYNPNVGEDYVPTITLNAKNGYTITVIAITSNIRWYDENDNRRRGKELRIGYSICNPSDEYDDDIAIRIAKHRAKKSPFCHLMSPFNGEFNDDTINALLEVKGHYILENLDNFINR